MKLKYFTYISPTKIDMLYAQAYPSKSLSLDSFKPKVSLLGMDLELGINAKYADDRLVEKTVKLVKKLHDMKLIRLLKKIEPDNCTEYFYYDESTWRSGVLEWNLKRERGEIIEKSKMYLAMKLVGDTMLLLVGSPAHLLGSFQVAARTTSTFHELTSTDIYEELQNSIREEMLGVIRTEENQIISAAKVEEHTSDLYSISWASTCLAVAKRLSPYPLETIFKVFTVYDIRKSLVQLGRGELPRSDRQLIEDAIRLGVGSISKIYIGSPLYTALG